MSAKHKNILIAVNTYDGHQYCRDYFVRNLLEIEKQSGAEIVIFYNGKPDPWGFEKWEKVYYEEKPIDSGLSILTAKNNLMRDYFLAGKYSHIFMLESDIIPPVDVIHRLHGYHLDTVTALYFIKSTQKTMIKMPNDTNWQIYDPQKQDYTERTIPAGNELLMLSQTMIPSIWGFINGKSALWQFEDAFPQRGLVRIYSAGIGSVLIKRKVMEKCGLFEMRDITSEIQQFTDYLYFKKIHDNGFQAFVDTGCICQHVHYDFDWFVQKRWFDVKTQKACNGPKV